MSYRGRRSRAHWVPENARLLAYGSLNVYDVGGKAYYADHVTHQMVRAPERDNLIKRCEMCGNPLYGKDDTFVELGLCEECANDPKAASGVY